MKFYNTEEIRAQADCRQVAQLVGADVHDNRCAATWRNGDNPNAVSLEKDKWYDHVAKVGGSAIDLVTVAVFSAEPNDPTTFAQSQEWLGERLNLVPREVKGSGRRKPSRYDKLLADGYRNTATYWYRDEDGNPLHCTARLEHDTLPKEFVQGTQKHWGVKGTRIVLYNLPTVIASNWVIIVEGEKDADNLIAADLPATTCPMGAEKWRDEFDEIFLGKSVAILPDNDEVGQKHADTIAWRLRSYAAEIRIVKTSGREKGDVSDYLEDGHSASDVLDLIQAAKPIELESLLDPSVDLVIEAAKIANKLPFCNFTSIRKTTDDGATKMIDEPRQINALVKEVRQRFLGFPHKLGDQLFDHDRDSGRIEFLDRVAPTFAWIQAKSNQSIGWLNTKFMVPQEQFFESLRASAQRFEAISYVPDFPTREDVYYAHEALPEPSEGHVFLERFLDFFSLAEPAGETRALLKCFVAAPLVYRPGIGRPSWIIDSSDGPGTGKTSVAELIAQLYGSEHGGGDPIWIKQADLSRNVDEVIKRILSNEGRMARVFLIDNVTGKFSSSVLCGFVTAKRISGKRPYGRGEETRPNNLTYVVTANSATVDDDFARRSFYLTVCRPSSKRVWRSEVQAYIDANRPHILADLTDLLSRGASFEIDKPATRFPEFEIEVLATFCKDEDEYKGVIALLNERRSESNAETEEAQQIIDVIEAKLAELMLDAEKPIFIHSRVVAEWLRYEVYTKSKGQHSIMQEIRTMAKSGLLPRIHAPITKYPHNGSNRRRGIMWGKPERKEFARIIGFSSDNQIRDITTKYVAEMGSSVGVTPVTPVSNPPKSENNDDGGEF